MHFSVVYEKKLEELVGKQLADYRTARLTFIENFGLLLLLASLMTPQFGCSVKHEHDVVTAKDLRVVAASAGADYRPGRLSLVAVENRSNETLSLLDARVIMPDGTLIPSRFPGARFSSPEVGPGECEYALLRIPQNVLIEGGKVRIDVKAKNAAQKYSMSEGLGAIAWSPVAFSSGGERLTTYAFTQKGVGSEPNCQVNGRPAKCVSTAVFPTADGRRLVAVEIASDRGITPGERVVVEFSCDGEVNHIGVAKAFPAFVCGKTSYQHNLRAVSIEHATDWMTLSLYNEADYRKCPVSIKAVAVDGKDVTHLCRLPSDALPPDRQQFEQDLRQLGIPNASLPKSTKRHRIDIRYKRLQPQQSGPIPDDYFEMLTYSFFVHQGVPLPLEHEHGVGVETGACLADALRPLQPKEDFLSDSEETIAVDASIPVFACLPGSLEADLLQNYARYCDFVVLDQQAKQGNDASIAESLEKVCHSVPFAASFNVFHESPAEIGDLERLAWSSIGMGGRGVMLGVGSRGDPELVARRNATVSRVLKEVRHLRPLLEKSFPLRLVWESNQQGVRCYFLACGTEDLLMIAINDWCSRAAPYRKLPSCFATRLGVSVRLEHGAEWIPRFAQDPITGKPISLTLVDDGNSLVDLPRFQSVQVVLLRQDAGAAVKPLKTTFDQGPPPIVFRDSPVVSLGAVRPGSEHRVKIPVRSLANVATELIPDEALNDTSNPGKCIASSVLMSGNDDGTIEIAYTAPLKFGESVTSLRFSTADAAFIRDVYVCANVQNPANLSPAQIFFDNVVPGRAAGSRRIKLESPDITARIETVSPDREWAKGIRIAEDGRSFELTLSMTPDFGWQTANIGVGIRLNNDAELYEDSVSVRVHTTPAVFSTPSKLVVVQGGSSRRFTLRLRHADGKRIRVAETFHNEAIRVKRAGDEFANVQIVEVELAADIGRKDLGMIRINGYSDGSEPFQVEVPVSVIGLSERADSGSGETE